jgi:hypothetical protein
MSIAAFLTGLLAGFNFSYLFSMPRNFTDRPGIWYLDGVRGDVRFYFLLREIPKETLSESDLKRGAPALSAVGAGNTDTHIAGTCQAKKMTYREAL